MITEYIRYSIQDAAQRSAFEDAYAKASLSLDASENCLAYDLSHCHEEPERYVLRIHWDSLAGHLEGFRKSPEFRSFLAEIRPYIPNIEEMQHYNATDVHADPSVAGQSRDAGVDPGETSHSGDATIYGAVGGVHTFFRLAKRMHEEMRDDAILKPMFARAAAAHVPHLAMWLCEVFGGPPLYSETLGDIGPMLARHANLDIQEPQRAAFVACVERALEAVLPADATRAQQAILSYIEWGTHVAVTNSKPDHKADPDAGVPTWDWGSDA